MLQRIREFTQGIFAWILVIFICLSFSLWGIHSYIESSAANEVVAHVNGVDITQKQLQIAYDRFRDRQSMQMGENFNPSPAVEKQLKQQILNQLITNQVLLQSAIAQGMRFTVDQLNQVIRTIPAFQMEGQFSPARFHEVLSNTGFNEQEFLMDMHSAMLINQARTGITLSTFVLPAEVVRDYALTAQKRDIAYVIVPQERYLNDIIPSEADIKSYYDQHKNDFKTPEKMSIEYLMLSLPQIKEEMTVIPAESRQYYEENISNFTHPARLHLATLLIRIPKEASVEQIASAESKINALSARVKKGENFETLVRTYSEDPLSKTQGGDLGWSVVGTIDPLLERTAMALSPGGVSEPVRTKYGLNLIKLVGIEKASQAPFSKVKAQIEQILLDQKTQQRYSDLSEQLANLTYANPNSLAPAAKQLHLTIQTTPLFTRTGNKDAMLSNQKVLLAAFNPIVIHQKNNSDLIEIDTNHAIVLRAKQYFPESIKPLSEVSSHITDLLKHRAAQAKALEAAQVLARTKNTKLGTLRENLGRNDTALHAMLLVYAFGLPKPSQANPVSRVVFSLPNGDAAVVTLLKVHDLSNMPNPQQQATYAEQLVRRFGQMDYDRYVAGLFKKAKIKINDTLSS